jgi:hypothetical protein
LWEEIAGTKFALPQIKNIKDWLPWEIKKKLNFLISFRKLERSFYNVFGELQ